MPDDFVSDFLPDLDDVRGIGGELGLRPYVVYFITRIWSGGRPGQGSASTSAPLYLTTGNGRHRVIVEKLSAKEIAASGALYRDRDMRVGPVTPAYMAQAGYPPGGFLDSQLNPLVVPASTIEVFWNVAGPDMPAGGAWCDRVSGARKAMDMFFVLRATGRTP